MLSMDQGLYPEQRVTTRLVQTMHILQMSTPELEEYLEELSMENPVIELRETAQDASELARMQEWLSGGDWQNRCYDREDRNPESLWRDSTEETLHDHLAQQLLLSDYNRQERRVLSYLLSSLDSDGYFREELQEAAARCGVSRDTAESMLGVIQSLEPAGVGAADLRECLLLQARRAYPGEELLEQIIRRHLNDLGKNHLRQTARTLGVSVQEISDCLEKIRSLNPKPGCAFFSGEEPQYVRPDALIVERNGQFQAVLRENCRLTLETSTFYRELAKTAEDSNTRMYLQEKLRQVDSVKEEIAIRRDNLARVLDYLAARQEDFFRWGPGHKSPMHLKDLAEELRVHPSTVSRTMRGKYLQCGWGVFPLSDFLSGAAVVSQTCGLARTQEEVKERLRGLIDSEDKQQPWSDEALVRLLGERHQIRIARRTVNKYRQEMRIPDRSGRRVWAG